MIRVVSWVFYFTAVIGHLGLSKECFNKMHYWKCVTPLYNYTSVLNLNALKASVETICWEMLNLQRVKYSDI